MISTHAKAPTLAWLLTALSCLLAGTAVFAIRPQAPLASGDAAASRVAIRRFYDAANAAIATGDPAPLAAVLTPDYAEADATGALVPGRVALERQLRTLHEIAPDLQLDTADLVGDGDRMVAVVGLRGGVSATALGLPLDAPVLWGSVDVFRVANGRIAAREGPMAPGILLDRRVTTSLDLPPMPGQVPTLQRLSIAPGARFSAPAVDGPVVLVVEAGELAVAARGAALPGDVATLAAGEWVVLPAGADYDARNAREAPATLLEVLVTATTALPSTSTRRAEGVTTHVLAGGLLTPVPMGRTIVRTGRLTLAPGARLAWSEPTGPTLLFVEAGTLDLATRGVSAWVRSAADGASESRGATTLVAGDGARIGMGTGAEIRSAGDGPVEVLAVTLLPAN